MGDWFKSAWQGSEDVAKSAAAAVATAGSSTVHAAEWAANKTAEVAVWAEQKGISAAKATGAVAVAVGRAGLAAGEKVAQVIGKEASALAGATWKGMTHVAAIAYDAISSAFNALKAGAYTVGCMLHAVSQQSLGDAAISLWNFGANSAGTLVALGLTAPLNPLHSLALRGLEALTDRNDMKAYDGHVVGAGCSDNPPSSHPSGVTPSADSGCSGVKGKITYVNGINTEFHPNSSSSDKKAGICYTMQKIADLTCSEVTGVYNATEGIGKDLAECEQNIEALSETAPVKVLADEIADNVRNGTTMTVFAHSQGGLVTQEALMQARIQLKIDPGWTDVEIDEAMSRVVTVKSFGTAIEKWPPGPNYEQFTNRADPVPHVITAAQLNLSPLGVPHAAIPADQQHYFWSAHGNPIDSHNMDDVYLEYYAQVKGEQ